MLLQSMASMSEIVYPKKKNVCERMNENTFFKIGCRNRLQIYDRKGKIYSVIKQGMTIAD